jgi:hypothetical protein
VVAKDIEAKRTPEGELPDEADAAVLAEAKRDAWGTPLKYAAGGMGGYAIVSAGRDKQFDTDDDIRMSADDLKTPIPSGEGIQLDD